MTSVVFFIVLTLLSAYIFRKLSVPIKISTGRQPYSQEYRTDIKPLTLAFLH